MKTKIEQILDQCLKGREIAIWGSPTRLLIRQLGELRFHEAYEVHPKKHFVIVVNDSDLEDFLSDEQSKFFRYVYDYIQFDDLGGEIPFEWNCFGAKIGRQTYFGEKFVNACKNGYVKEIGHFTSINSTAGIANDHQHNMVFQSDDISHFFTKENKEKFRNNYLADPKKPYDSNQRQLTIGSDVWIGANVFINCSKVTSIGHGAIIGSGAVVLENVPPYAVVLGVPGKIKKYRFSPEMIETLLSVKWWDWPEEKINENADMLMCPNLFFEKFGI